MMLRLELWRCAEGVIRGRRGNRPLQALRTFPYLRFRRRLAGNDGADDVEAEQQLAETIDERTDRRHHVEVGELQGVVRDPARHACQAHEMLREEGQVE